MTKLSETLSRLAEIKARAEKATPGPWSIAPHCHDDPISVVSEYKATDAGFSANWIAECDLQDDDAQNEANALLVAAAPDMAEALEQARALLKLAVACADDWNCYETNTMGDLKRALGEAGLL